MAPHSKTSYTGPVGSRRSSRVKTASDSDASTSSSVSNSSRQSRSRSQRARSASISSEEPTKRRSRRARSASASSVSSESSIASTASLESVMPSTSRAGAEERVRGDNGKGAARAENGTHNGGVQKRRKKTARLTAPKRAKRAYKPRKDALEKVLREEAAGEDFMLADLEWSDWKRAIQRRMPNTSSSWDWEPRLKGQLGARHQMPFDDTSRPAVYEVAVKVPDQHDKVPVLATVRQNITGQSWEAALLSKDKIRNQVDKVLKKGCKLYVRQAPFSVRDMGAIYRRCGVVRKAGSARNTEDAVSELRGLMARVCDYAWREHYDIPSRTYSHRRLVVNKVRISD